MTKHFEPCPCGSGKKFKKCHGDPRRMPTFQVAPLTKRPLTRAECLTTARVLRETFQRFRLTPNSTSDLARMITELEWLADNLDPTPAAIDRHNRAFPLIDQAGRIANAASALHDVEGADTKLKRLLKQINRLTTQDAAGQDYLLEVEVAGRLARAGLTPAFAEPDVVAHTHAFGPVKIACKRPRRRAGFRDNLREAAKQIRKSGGPAVTVVSIEAILQPVGTGDDPLVGDAYLTRDNLADATHRAVTQVVTEENDAIQEHMISPDVAGVFIWGLTAAKIIGGPSYAREWQSALRFPDDDRRRRIAKRISGALMEGAPR